MIGRLTLCGICSNTTGPNEEGRLTCTAFPDGIPNPLLVEGFDHRGEYPGDNGVRFEIRPGENPRRYLERYDVEGDSRAASYEGSV